MTMSDAPMSATTAIQSVAVPASAMTRNAAFSTSENPMFIRMLRAAARLRRIAKGIFGSSSAISATSAVSSAASVPATPIAMPTLAVASAGASLTPSPTIASTP